jgi:hypothetical protein
MCRYVCADRQLKASFWRVVLYWVHERVSAGRARSRGRASVVQSSIGAPAEEHASKTSWVARHRRHGATATPIGNWPTVMSVGCLVLVFTSIVETVPLVLLATKAVLPSGVTATLDSAFCRTSCSSRRSARAPRIATCSRPSPSFSTGLRPRTSQLGPGAE